MNASPARPARESTRLPTCCIIGAGICGLTTAKALKDHRVPFDWFELSDRIGGVWAFNNPNGRSAAYRSLHIDSSKSRIAFEDFPPPADWPEYPHHLQIAEYLKSYAERFDLAERITYSTEVVRVSRAADGTWSVTLSSGETRTYGAVAVCNGHHWDPRWPTPAYPGTFIDEQMHAASYIDPFAPIDMRNKTVLVVGMGNSAMDISCELSPRHIARELLVSARRGVYIFPRFMLGRAADKGKVYRWLPLGLQTAFSKWIYRRVVGRMEDYGLPKPDHELFESHGTVSDEFPSRVAAGDIQIRPGLARLDGDGVVFTDGRREKVDVIVWATGYNVTLPFFDKEVINVDDNRLPLYRRMFKPGTDGLIFIGLLQSTVTIFTIAEKQARLAAIVLGSALGTFFMAFHSTQGPQLGLPQMIQSRPQFGRRGALLVWGMALVNYIGFNAFSQVLAGQTMQELARIEPHLTLVVFTGAAMIIAVFGHDSIHAVQRPLSYLLILCMLVFSIGTIVLQVPFGDLSQSSFKTVPFLTQLFAATAYQLSWSIYVSDYSRFLPRDVGVTASFLWTYFGALLGGAWMMEVGALVTVMNPHLEVAAAVLKSGDTVVHGLGTVLLAAASGGLLTVTAINLYGGSLTLLSAADSIQPIRYTRRNRIYSLLLVGAVSTAVALLLRGDYVSGFSDLLTILLYIFTPWTSINLVDFYFVRRGCYSIREIFKDDGMYGQWNWRGLVAYAAGFTAMIPFFSTGFYVGPIARHLGGADLAMIVGLPVSAITYLLACRSMDLVAERSRAIEADRGLDPDEPRPGNKNE